MTPSEAVRAAIPFGVIVVAFAAWDTWRASKRDGSTASELIRLWFRTDTDEGRELFLATVNIGTKVFIKHILK